MLCLHDCTQFRRNRNENTDCREYETPKQWILWFKNTMQFGCRQLQLKPNPMWLLSYFFWFSWQLEIETKLLECDAIKNALHLKMKFTTCNCKERLECGIDSSGLIQKFNVTTEHGSTVLSTLKQHESQFKSTLRRLRANTIHKPLFHEFFFCSFATKALRN